MMYVISRYNQDLSWLKDYTNDFVIYDRSETPLEGSIVVPNIGSDIYDKFTYIIDNYDKLPDVAVYCKANLFKYISKEEFDLVKNNKTFTPLLTKHHKVDGNINFYSDDGLYNEKNDYWYLSYHPCRNYGATDDLKTLLSLRGKDYLRFAPGANYILTKENILKHSKDDYIKLRSYLEWAVYPGEAQLLERGLYYLWS